MADTERKALADADIVVGHLRSVVDDVAAYFRFPEPWLEKCVIEHPPVLVAPDLAKRDRLFDEHTPLVFTSKVQWFKRPHVFVNAAVAFMKAVPEFKGEALLLAHVIDDELGRHCEGLIPKDLIGRIRIVEKGSNQLRETLLRGSFFIFPIRTRELLSCGA